MLDPRIEYLFEKSRKIEEAIKHLATILDEKHLDLERDIYMETLRILNKGI